VLTWNSYPVGTQRMAVTTGTSASVVNAPAVPGQRQAIYLDIQLQDGAFIGSAVDDSYNWYMVAFDQSGGIRWSMPNYYPIIATADGGLIATIDGVSATIFDQNGNATGQIPDMPTQSWPGNSYLGNGGSVQAMNMLPIQWASSFASVGGGNPSGNCTSVPFLKWMEGIALWGGGRGPKCQLGDAQVPLGGEELQQYTATRQALLDGGYLTCPNCLKFFMQNPAGGSFFVGGLTGAVQGQVPYDGDRTTISKYAAGLWDATDLANPRFPSQWLKTPVCTDFQATSANGSKNATIAEAQTQAPGTDVYLTTKAKLWRKYLTQGMILHESIHNLTGWGDDKVEVLLGLPPTASEGAATDIISQTLEEHQCAGPPQ